MDHPNAPTVHEPLDTPAPPSGQGRRTPGVGKGVGPGTGYGIRGSVVPSVDTGSTSETGIPIERWLWEVPVNSNSFLTPRSPP